jgi:predicted DNA-binding transcriptional regulator AlpA
MTTLVNAPKAAKMLDITRSRFYAMRRKKGFPRGFQVAGTHQLFYRVSDLEKYLEKHRVDIWPFLVP